MKFRAVFVAIAMLLATKWLWSFSINEMTARQRDHEAVRLRSHGYTLSFSENLAECAPEGTVPEQLVRFCIFDENVLIKGGPDWDRKIGHAEAVKLANRWILPYLRVRQPAHARYAATRLVTLVVRDRLGAIIAEPLPPLLPPISGDIANRSPSQVHRTGMLLAVMTLVFCMLLARIDARRSP